jgi:hypothetical protein
VAEIDGIVARPSLLTRETFAPRLTRRKLFDWCPAQEKGAMNNHRVAIVIVAATCLVSSGPTTVLGVDLQDTTVTIKIEDRTIAAGQQATIALDVTFQGTDVFDDHLFAYDLWPVLDLPAGGHGLRFAPPYAEEPATNFVFAGQPTDFEVPSNPAPSPTQFRLFAVNNGFVLPAIGTTPVTAARILLDVDPDVQPGIYNVRLRPDATSLATGYPEWADSILLLDVDQSDTGVITVTPEPAAFVIFSLVGPWLLLRGRRRGSTSWGRRVTVPGR